MIFEWDDFGANHIISDQCQSHDCRDYLYRLKDINPAFKATMFAIPGEMTPELTNWCMDNGDWIELAVHGFFHTSNYECEKIGYEVFGESIEEVMKVDAFKKIFRAPGWQISDEALRWLADNGWIICDQGYNDERRPHYAKAYVNYDGKFIARHSGKEEEIEAYHGHTWDVGWNGIYEDFENVSALVASKDEFKFISEVFA